MKKLTHAQANALLAAYAAQELAPGERQPIETHLETCSTCQHSLEEIRHIRSLLRSFALTDALSASSPSGFHEASLTRSRTTSRRIAKNISSRKATPRPRLIPIIAALLTLALIISTAAILTYAAQGNTTLSGKGKTPTPTTPCLTPSASVPTPTPTITLSPTPSVPTPTPTARSNDGCATPTPGEPSTPTPSPTPAPPITPTPLFPTPTPTIGSFGLRGSFQ